MYVGHVGAALAGKRARASVGLLVLLLAAYAPDWVDTGLCLANTYNEQSMLSHSIPAVLSLALLGFFAYFVATRDRTGATVVAAVVISHILLDYITGYKPTWPGGPMIGLQLYDHPIADFFAELIAIVVGAALYRKTLPASEKTRTHRYLMVGLLVGLQLAADISRMTAKNLSKC